MGAKKPDAASSNGEAASSRLDGDELRAQRLEGAETRTWVLFGTEWELVPELPFAFAEVWRTSPSQAIKRLFIEPADGDKLLELGPSDADVGELIRSYGTDQGKSSASSRS